MAPNPPAPSHAPSAKIATVFHAPWGSGPEALGRNHPKQGNPEGPASFAIDRHGKVYVLDQVNRRVQVFENSKVVGSIPLPTNTFQDLTVDDNGRMVVLDRLAKASLTILDPTGRVEREVPLPGLSVPEGGAVTAMFTRDDGTWVEVEHRDVVRIADSSGSPDEQRPTAPGRLSGDRRVLLSAALDGRNAAVVLGRSTSSPDSILPLARVEFPMTVLQLTALESDRLGRVFLAASLASFREEEPFDVLSQVEVVVILSPDGAEIGRVTFPARPGPEEQFKPLVVGLDGAVYQLGFDSSGVTLRRFVP